MQQCVYLLVVWCWFADSSRYLAKNQWRSLSPLGKCRHQINLVSYHLIYQKQTLMAFCHLDLFQYHRTYVHSLFNIDADILTTEITSKPSPALRTWQGRSLAFHRALICHPQIYIDLKMPPPPPWSGLADIKKVPWFKSGKIQKETAGIAQAGNWTAQIR